MGEIYGLSLLLFNVLDISLGVNDKLDVIIIIDVVFISITNLADYATVANLNRWGITNNPVHNITIGDKDYKTLWENLKSFRLDIPYHYVIYYAEG